MGSTVTSPLNKGIKLTAFNKPIIGIAKVQDLPSDGTRLYAAVDVLIGWQILLL